MRRPLKPFVTEYKATNRRPKDGTGLFGMEPGATIAEAPTRKSAALKAASPKPAQAVRRNEAQQRSSEAPRYNGAQSEDSYEAAMRAADALFSGVSSRDGGASPTTAAPQDVLVRSEGSSQPGTEPLAAGTGRILRVIDEEPNPALLEMEAERTPKRRGRKPGSKNKPKAPASDAPPTPERLPEQSHAVDSGHDHVERTAPRPAPTKILVFPAAAPRGERRFAWVRTELRPGEAWKRRLPKVIW